MTEESTFPGFVARLQAKSDADSEKLSYMGRKYIEAMGRCKRRKEKVR